MGFLSRLFEMIVTTKNAKIIDALEIFEEQFVIT